MRFSVGDSSSPMVWASTDSSFDFEAMRTYNYVDIREDDNSIYRVTCKYCGVVNAVDIKETGLLRCGACGGKLSIDDEEDKVEEKQVRYKEYKPTWLEKFFHKEYRNSGDEDSDDESSDDE